MHKITLTSSTRQCVNPNRFLGYEGENQANKLIFTFSDGFVDGLGQLYIQRGEDKGYVTLDKVGETYESPVKSSVLSQAGEIEMQVVITKIDGTIIKYDLFTMEVKDAIDTDSELPEEYPSWQEAIAEMLAQAQDTIDRANETSDQIIQAKENGEFNGKDGENGVDGISPEISVKSNTETEYVLTIKDKNGSFNTPNLKGRDGEGGGITVETDPLYSADKPKLALKTELPTKLSQLQNDSNFISNYTETDPTVPAHVKAITENDINKWNNPIIPNIVTLTQSEYNALVSAGTIDENTYYFIKEG